jgi:SAM-dependent methyltransferase
MPRYALLILPAVNRVYAAASVELTRAELDVFNGAVLDGRLSGIGIAAIGGVPYVTFDASGGGLGDRDVAFLANLSAAYALFEVADGGLLRPVELRPLDRYDDDLVTIQKYAGKTNEVFTKLLVNVTVLASASAPLMLDRQLRVLDPLCGRGTTLNQALMYGYDAAGLELDRKDHEAYTAFVRTWLQRKRLKHQFESGPVRRNGKVVGRRMQATLAPDKDSYRAGRTQHLDVVNADTLQALEFFRPQSFDVVVADAPYGVQHGSRSPSNKLARNPLALLEAAVPVWARLLRAGGALGIAWNSTVAPREAVTELLREANLAVADAAPYLAFRHRVDQAIVRDIAVGRKPLS